MGYFVIIVNGWKPLTIITKSFILDVAAVLDPPLSVIHDNINSIRKNIFSCLVSDHNITSLSRSLIKHIVRDVITLIIL